MSNETKGDHDSLHLGETIESMRQKLLLDDVGAYGVLRSELTPGCMRWVRYGRNIPWQDAEDIVAQAIERTLDHLLSDAVSPEEASLQLKTALNTARAEYLRRIKGEQGFGDYEKYEAAFQLYEEVDFTEQVDRENEENRREEHLLVVLESLRDYFDRTLGGLRPRDYAILHDLYNLGSIGMPEPFELSPMSALKPGARRVAVFRARKRFLDGLYQLLREDCQTLRDKAKILEDVMKLIDGGHLVDALAVQQRQQPN